MDVSALGPLHRQAIREYIAQVPATPATQYVRNAVNKHDFARLMPARFDGYKTLVLRHVIYHVSPYALAQNMVESRIETCYATMHYLPEIFLNDYCFDGLTNHFVKRVGDRIEAGFVGDVSNHYSTPLDIYLAWIQVPAGFTACFAYFNVEMIHKHGSLVTFKIQRVARQVDHPARPIFVGKEYLLVGTSSSITSSSTFATLLIDDNDLKRPVGTVRTLTTPPDIREVQAIINSIQHRLNVNKTLISSGPLADLQIVQQEVLNVFVYNKHHVGPIARWACRVATGRPFWIPFATSTLPLLLKKTLLQRTEAVVTATPAVSRLAYSAMSRLLESFGSLTALPPNLVVNVTSPQWIVNTMGFQSHYAQIFRSFRVWCEELMPRRSWLLLPLGTLICSSIYYVGRSINRAAYATSYYRGRRTSVSRYAWFAKPFGTLAYCLALPDRKHIVSALFSLALAKIIVAKALELYLRRDTDHDNDHDQEIFDTLRQKFPGPGMEPVLLRTANIVTRQLHYCAENDPGDPIPEGDLDRELIVRGIEALNIPDPVPYQPPEPAPDHRVNFEQLVQGLKANGVGVNFYDLTQGLRRNVDLKAGVHNDKLATWCFLINAVLNQKPDAKIVIYCCLGSNLTNIGRLSSLVPNVPVIVVIESTPTTTLNGSPNWYVMARADFASRLIGAAADDMWLMTTQTERAIVDRFSNTVILSSVGDRIPFSRLKLDPRSTLKLRLPSDIQFSGCWDCVNIAHFGHTDYFTQLCNLMHKPSPVKTINGREDYVWSMRTRNDTMGIYTKVRNDLYGVLSPNLRACANTYPQLFLPRIVFPIDKGPDYYIPIADFLLREAGFIHSVASQLIEQVELFRGKICRREEMPFTRGHQSMDSEFFVYQNKLYHATEVEE